MAVLRSRTGYNCNYLSTGNEYISLPRITTQGGIMSAGFLDMGFNANIDFGGRDDMPLISPFINIDEKNINKHKRDVFRLGAGLKTTDIILPSKIRSDLKMFVQIMEKEKPEVVNLLKLMGINNLTRDDILSTLNKSFRL